jgi:hypothetical protein
MLETDASSDKLVHLNYWRSWDVERTVLNAKLTNSMKQSSSWEAVRFSATQEITRISWNPKVHHRIHKNALPALVVRQTAPLNTTGLKLAKQKVDIAMLFFLLGRILCSARSWHLVHTLCLCDVVMKRWW